MGSNKRRQQQDETESKSPSTAASTQPVNKKSKSSGSSSSSSTAKKESVKPSVSRSSSSPPLYKLKLLQDRSRPPVWRSVIVPSDISLHTLHVVIQAAFHWQSMTYDYHLHQFSHADSKRHWHKSILPMLRVAYAQTQMPIPANILSAGNYDPMDDMEEAAFREINGPYPEVTQADLEEEMKVKQVLPRVGSMIRYEYDFGCSWRLQIIVQKILAANSDEAAKYTQLPVCVGGRMNAPPEDGATQSDIERAEAGEEDEENYGPNGERTHTSWDPKHFDKKEINDRMRLVELY